MEQNKVKFKYIFDSAVNPKYANGCFRKYNHRMVKWR